MDIWHDVAEVPARYGPSAVTLGNFDGVHRGHRVLLSELAARARAEALKAVAVTFWPHPATVHHPEIPQQRLCSLAERLQLMEDAGLDAVLVVNYTLDFAQLSPEEFVRRYLVEPFGARSVLIGSDVRFGWRNTGDLTTMRELGERFGFAVEALDDAGPDANGVQRRWSSSWVRELLDAGDTEGAAAVLGRWPTVCGTVVHGQSRGRSLGFPTANLGGELAGMVPADGVYAGWLYRPTLPPGEADRLMPAAISIGTNPTFGDDSRQVEAHVPGRDDLELYDEWIELRFARRIRHMLKFSDARDLVVQMRADVDATLHALAGRDPDAVQGAEER